MGSRSTILLSFVLMPVFVLLAAWAPIRSAVLAQDRCTLKLAFLGPNNWVPSCSGDCAASGGSCWRNSIGDTSGNTIYWCQCGDSDPIVNCDSIFAHDTGQTWILIQCTNDQCASECDVTGGYGQIPIPACYCP